MLLKGVLSRFRDAEFGIIRVEAIWGKIPKHSPVSSAAERNKAAKGKRTAAERERWTKRGQPERERRKKAARAGAPDEARGRSSIENGRDPSRTSPRPLRARNAYRP